MRRKDRQMSEEFAWEVVKKCDYAVLSMNTEDGSPYGVAVNIFLDGCDIYFHSATEGKKIECMKKYPQICLTCVARSEVIPEKLTTYYSSAIVFGTVEEVISTEEKIDLMYLMCKKYGVPMTHEAMNTKFVACMPKTAIWRVKVTAITGKARQN